MKKWMIKLVGSKLTIRWKINAGSMLIISVLIVLMGIFIYVRVSGMEYRAAVQQYRTLTRTMGARLDENSDAFINQINFVALDGTMADLLSVFYQSSSNYQTISDMRSLISLRSNIKNEIGAVSVYDTDGKEILSWDKASNTFGHYSLPTQLELSGIYPSGRITCEMENGQLIYSRAVRMLDGGEIVGYISFLYNKSQFQNKLEILAEDRTCFLGLYDSTSHQMITTNQTGKNAYLQALDGMDMTELPEGITTFVEGVGEVLLCGTASINDGWYVVSGIRSSEIYESRSVFITVILCFFLVGMAMILCINILNERIVSRPVRQIMQAVKRVQEEDYEITLNVRTGDELEELARSFEVMAHRMDHLINQNLKAGLAYREMQLAQLQQQIEPHFLYNTLECVNSLAQLERKDDVRHVTNAFARLMQSKMNDQIYVTVREEISCAEAFLEIYKIMQARFLDYEIQVDTEILDWSIPSLIVQPMVENAVLHGIIPSGRKGIVTVEVHREEELLAVTVSDDGIGMEASKIRAIEAYAGGTASQEEKASLGIGVKNVLKRIRLLYGSGEYVTVLSDPEWGTTFTFMLPQSKEEDSSIRGME